jgi:serine protease Do
MMRIDRRMSWKIGVLATTASAIIAVLAGAVAVAGGRDAAAAPGATGGWPASADHVNVATCNEGPGATGGLPASAEHERAAVYNRRPPNTPFVGLATPADDNRVGSASGAAHDAIQFDRDRAAVVRAAADRAGPGIVTIETVGGAQPNSPQDGPGGQPAPPLSFQIAEGPTTGIIWSSDGYIITSTLNFARNPTIITVVLPAVAGSTDAPRRHVARLIARDAIRRIALIRIDAGDLTVPAWTPSDAVKPGQYALACGRGLGAPRASGDDKSPDYPMIQQGIISAVGRRNGNAIQTDANTSPVNYGGPLLDIEGRVMGVIVPMGMGASPTAGVEWYDSGIGFAVTRSAIERVIDTLKAGRDVIPGKLGVVFESTPEDPRCRVTAVADPSPALDAGIAPDDVVQELDGRTVGDQVELNRRLSDLAAGDTVTLKVQRGENAREIKLTLARPEDIGDLPQPEPPQPAQPAGED